MADHVDLRELGNLFMVGFDGQDFTGEIRDLLDDLNPCGVILFSRNIEGTAQVARLNRRIQMYAHERLSHGLLIGVDQEGGRVCRLTEPFSRFPPALEMARSHDPEGAVRKCAHTTARELKLLGFNVNFVPVLDVLSSEDTPERSVIGDRSFGSDADLVARLGRTVIEATRASGVIPCAKHFPGHGGTAVDSHVELPIDTRPADTIMQRDVKPFRAATDLRVEMVMTAHILYSELDAAWPATMSRPLIGDLLRRDMEYRGVVITDDLDMGAVAARYTVEESAVRALSAGVDILLVCRTVDKAFAGRSALHEALRSGQLSASRVEEALGRVKELKSRYKSSLNPCREEDVGSYFV